MQQVLIFKKKKKLVDQLNLLFASQLLYPLSHTAVECCSSFLHFFIFNLLQNVI